MKSPQPSPICPRSHRLSPNNRPQFSLKQRHLPTHRPRPRLNQRLLRSRHTTSTVSMEAQPAAPARQVSPASDANPVSSIIFLTLLLFSTMIALVVDWCNTTTVYEDGQETSVSLCGPHGSCHFDQSNGSYCVCDAGWSGQFCDTRKETIT